MLRAGHYAPAYRVLRYFSCDRIANRAKVFPSARPGKALQLNGNFGVTPHETERRTMQKATERLDKRELSGVSPRSLGRSGEGSPRHAKRSPVRGRLANRANESYGPKSGSPLGLWTYLQSLDHEDRDPLAHTWFGHWHLQYDHGPTVRTPMSAAYKDAMSEWHAEGFASKQPLPKFRDWLFRRCQRVAIVDGVRTIEAI